MAYFRFTTVDTRGKPVIGHIEAVDADEARERLAELGIPLETVTVEQIPTPQGGPALSGEDAAQLAGQVSGLTAAGLPLGAGLRALAEEIPRRNLRTVLNRIAGRVEAGDSLEAAVASQGHRVPEYVRSLLTASVASGRFADVLEQLVMLERNRAARQRRLRVLLTYPTILVLFTVALLVFFGFLVVPAFGKIFDDFGADLPDMTKLVLAMHRPAGGVILLVTVGIVAVAVFLGFRFRSRVAWVQRVMYWVPLLGPSWRFRGLADFSQLLALLIDLKVPLPQALLATASGLREGDLRAASQEAAALVETGVPLSEALMRVSRFPRTFRPLIQWGERTSALSDALRGTAEMSEARLRFQSVFLGTVAPLMALMFIGFAVGFVIISMFMPLISLIQKLS